MNLPVDFTQYTRSLLGDEEYQQLEEALQSEAPVSVRVNRSKWQMTQEATPVPWSTTGYYLPQRPTFTFDPLFHAGCYYVQEASSMFVEQVLRTYVEGPVKMLDLCAAPGGKSTHARSVLPEGSLLVANEVMRNRAQILVENLMKWGHPEVVVTQSMAADYAQLGPFFDVILTDVPCSGEGMFRKDEGAVREWSAENVQLCWQRQQEILTDIWQALKPGGLLIYSTCTYNLHEDEENVAWLMKKFGAEVLEVPTQPEWNIVGNLAGASFPVYHFLPHHTKGEGFFLSALRKPMEADEAWATGNGGKKKKNKGGKSAPKAPAVPENCKGAVAAPEEYLWTVEENCVKAFPKVHAEALEALKGCVKVIHAGILVGELKGKDVLPHQSLALTTALRRDAFPQVELTYEEAITYLRKESLVLPADTPRGMVLLTYRGVPLGFVKNIGNRANNLYPQEWRIRSGYLPEEISCL
jgi:16S rRNA C967 or C1407 C5-methylase (RsmB/RsmF family)/NOL1/NOP2/fmu family ribosome biogenesis protein